MATYTSFEQLECWQLCREVVQWVRGISETFPAYERYDMTSNITRAARSATRNIAEGFGRYYYKERVKFAIMSRGSLYEILDDLITCQEEDYISMGCFSEGKDKVERAILSVNGYIRYLKSRQNDNG
jgi:four helix bundle protein